MRTLDSSPRSGTVPPIRDPRKANMNHSINDYAFAAATVGISLLFAIVWIGAIVNALAQPVA